MTQEELMELGLEEGAAERVMSLHEEALRQVTEERDALLTANRRRDAENAVREALLQSGANPKTVPLLMLAVDLDAVQPDEDGSAQNAVSPLKERYGEFFSAEQAEPVGTIDPPEGTAALDREALRSMDCGEINRRWSDVRSALERE